MKKIKPMPNIILMMLCMMISVSASAQCHLSKEGRKFIQGVEKCSLERYWDNGAWSIGYGHRMTGKMKQYKKITKTQAVKFLNNDLKESERIANCIIKELKWNPSQSFFDGLVSVIYNCGGGRIYKTEFYKRLKNCRTLNGVVNKNDLNFTVAAIKNARIPDGIYADGVKARRYLEHKLMLN